MAPADASAPGATAVARTDTLPAPPDLAGPSHDAGPSHGTTADEAAPAEAIDGGSVDAGTIDSGRVDRAPTDRGLIDAGLIDAGLIDVGATDVGPTDEEPADDGAAVATRGRGGRGAGVIVAAVLLSLLWPVMWVAGQGNADVLLGAGVEGPSHAFVVSEIPDLAPLEGIGHDGQQFYVIARHPFDPEAAGDAVSPAAYRYRRILFPLVAGAAFPDGGRGVIAAFFALSLLGVALGAWALLRLPGGPRWLPLVAAVNPAVITSLTLSLSDALGSGLAMAALALATRRRWAGAVALAVLAALTRETFLIVALGLAVAPGMPLRWRVASVAAPVVAVGGWIAWLGQQMSTSLLEGGSDQLAVPLTGYLSGDTDPQTFLMGGAAVVLLVLGAWRCSRIAPHVAVVLALQAVLLVCVSELVAFNWVNCVRTAAPMLPLAIWALVARPEADATADGAHDPSTAADGDGTVTPAAAT